MKKLILVFLMAVVITLAGCSTTTKNEEDSLDISILKDSTIDYLNVQFKDNNIKITDEEKITSIKEMFEGELKRNEESDSVKGWIYKITAKDSNNNQIEEFIIINDTNIKVKDKVYTCKKIDISRLDEIVGIDREN